MKEVKTKDGVTIRYVKNAEKSINGVCNVFDIYDKDGNLLGYRIGARDLKDIAYESLFDGDKMIYDPYGKLNGKTNGKSNWKTQKVKTDEPKVTTQTPGTTSVVKLTGGGFETSLKFRVTLRTKRKITVDDIIKYLEKKYEVWGYDIEAKTKEIETKNLGGDTNVPKEEQDARAAETTE